MHSVRMSIAVAGVLLGGVAAVPDAHQRATPESAVEGLLSADRTFAAASAKTTVIPALTAMFAKEITMPAPGNRFAKGLAEVVAALRTNQDNTLGRLSWAPIRGGVSADGRHGFTFGYMTLKRPSGGDVLLKYLAYWVKEPRGWRVMAYKRRPRPAGPVSLELMPPSLPAEIATVTPDSATLARFHESLDRTERAFSDEAQRIGIGAAFAKYGTVDAVNMGGPDDPGFVVGADAIGRSVSAGSPPDGSAVSWTPDRVIVAASGDLGITFGMIRPNAPAVDGKPQPDVPFFTIWRRARMSDAWRYIAE